MDEQDPKRHDMQPEILTRPDVRPEDAEKVVSGPPLSGRAPDEPVVSTGISSGQPLEHVGGAGLGKPPGEGNAGSVAETLAGENKAADPQDRLDPA